MTIHFSSATIQSYENKEKTMDLYYNPIVIFENEVTIEELKTAKWTIESDTIGNHELEILSASIPAIKSNDNRTFVEFKLSKKGISFSYDHYSCKIKLSVILEVVKEVIHEELALTHEVVGIVKTKWTKDLVE